MPTRRGRAGKSTPFGAPAHSRTRTASRSGLGVVEVLVALMLLTVGMLGVAGSSARSIRMAGAAARERRAVQRAADRVAVLASQGCATARSGSFVDSAASLSERWTVTVHASGTALVDADVAYVTPRGVRSVVLRSALLC